LLPLEPSLPLLRMISRRRGKLTTNASPIR
jgi:hypothetical protein